jgi:hypothetical protein
MAILRTAAHSRGSFANWRSDCIKHFPTQSLCGLKLHSSYIQATSPAAKLRATNGNYLMVPSYEHGFTSDMSKTLHMGSLRVLACLLESSSAMVHSMV